MQNDIIHDKMEKFGVIWGKAWKNLKDHRKLELNNS